MMEPGSKNLQPLMAGGKEYVPPLPPLYFCDILHRYGFETSVSHMIHRTQGVQLSDKGDDGSNVFQPTRCARRRPSTRQFRTSSLFVFLCCPRVTRGVRSGWAAEEAKRPRKLGGEGTRAPARATMGGAAAVKLARQEGVEVDRKKEADADMKTVGAGGGERVGGAGCYLGIAVSCVALLRVVCRQLARH